MTKILMAGVLALVSMIQVSPQTGKVSVQGIVTNYVTKEPLVDARVTIGISTVGPQASPNQFQNILTVDGTELTTVSDRQGRFAFPNLDPGYYMVRADADGYTTIAATEDGRNQASEWARGVSLRVGTGGGDVALSLVPLANIGGHVLSANGKGVAGIEVTVGKVAYPNGRRTWQGERYTRTNDRGEYQALWLDPGKYYVAVAPEEGGGTNRQFMAAYFPDATDFASANPIVVTNGSNVVADIQLPFKPSSLRRISGKVTTGVLVRETYPNGSSPGPDVVHLVPRGIDFVLDSPVSHFGEWWISNTGDFQIRDVAPGSYDLYAVSSLREHTYWGHTVVDVTDRDVTGLTVAFSTSATDYISGAIQDENGVVYPSNWPVLMRRTLLPFLMDHGDIRGGGSTFPTPSFGFSKVPPGTYDLLVSDGYCQGCYVAEIRQAGQSISDSGLVVGDKPLEPIEVLLRHDGGSLDVLVQGQRGRRGVLMLVPDPPRRMNRNVYQNESVAVGSMSTLENISPGRYKLFAIEGSINDEGLDVPNFLSKHENDGVAVTIRAKETTDARVVLIPRSVLLQK